MHAPPNVFAYLDHREYLQAWLNHRKQAEPGYSYAAFAAEAGLGRSTLANVVSGARMPSPSTVDGIARGLGLDPLGRNYLGLLVELARAPSVTARRLVLDRLLSRAAFGKTEMVEERDETLISVAANWYYPAVMELARLSEFRADPAWISEALMPRISEEQASEALAALVEFGLVVVREDGGAEVPIMRLHSQPETVARSTVAFHSRAVPAVVHNAITTIPAAERHMMGGVVLIPESLLPEAKQLINKTMQQLCNLGDGQDGTKRRAHQFAFHLIPVSRAFE